MIGEMSIDLAGEQEPSGTEVADRVGHPVRHRNDALPTSLAVHDQCPTADVGHQVFSGTDGDLGATHPYFTGETRHHPFPGTGLDEEVRPDSIRAWPGARFVPRNPWETIHWVCCRHSILLTPVEEPDE
jgi:hypothetical protein